MCISSESCRYHSGGDDENAEDDEDVRKNTALIFIPRGERTLRIGVKSFPTSE